MSQWCVESYPSSLYKFEIFSKLMFLAFWRNSGRGQGGPNPCLEQELQDCRIAGADLGFSDSRICPMLDAARALNLPGLQLTVCRIK